MSKHKYIIVGLLAAAVVMTAACSINRRETMKKNGYYKSLSRIFSYDDFNIKDYHYTDYKKLALNFDNLVFDSFAKGEYLPLIWKDKTYDTFGLPAYVGDPRSQKDGSQEAVTCMAAVLSATLNGANKSDEGGCNYVRMLNAYYNKDEKIILNNPSGSSATTSMWYLLYPAILYARISSSYPAEKQMAENVMNTITSWYNAYEVMYNGGNNADFNYTGYNFITKTPYKNNKWTEPDCVAGIAWLMDYAYELTGEEKYQTALKNCLDYSEGYFGGPLYEILQYYGPALDAKMNALYGTSYDMGQSLGRVFDGSSIPRGGWGSVHGKWGGYDVSGLFGSVTDRGGYAFAMNSFAAADAVIPVAKYDTRYAQAIGDWILRLTQSARYFFADETKPENQSVSCLADKALIPASITDTIPYEGIINSYNSKTPWFGGDPTINGWAETDFSLYSGAHIGLLSSRIRTTDQEGILCISLSEKVLPDELPFNLIYNPYRKDKKVKYTANTDTTVDLYNTVKNEYLAKSVTKETTITVPAKEALVIAELPAGTPLKEENGVIYAGSRFLSKKLSSVQFVNLKQNQAVAGKFTVSINLYSNNNDDIKEAVLRMEDKEITFTDKVTINTKDYGEGGKNLTVTVKTKNGMSDKAVIRLLFK